MADPVTELVPEAEPAAPVTTGVVAPAEPTAPVTSVEPETRPADPTPVEEVVQGSVESVTTPPAPAAYSPPTELDEVQVASPEQPSPTAPVPAPGEGDGSGLRR